MPPTSVEPQRPREEVGLVDQALRGRLEPPASANSPIQVVPIRLTSGVSPAAMALEILLCAASHGIGRHLDLGVGVGLRELLDEVAERVALRAHRPDVDGAGGLALGDPSLPRGLRLRWCSRAPSRSGRGWHAARDHGGHRAGFRMGLIRVPPAWEGAAAGADDELGGEDLVARFGPGAGEISSSSSRAAVAPSSRIGWRTVVRPAYRAAITSSQPVTMDAVGDVDPGARRPSHQAERQLVVGADERVGQGRRPPCEGLAGDCTPASSSKSPDAAEGASLCRRTLGRGLAGPAQRSATSGEPSGSPTKRIAGRPGDDVLGQRDRRERCSRR